MGRIIDALFGRNTRDLYGWLWDELWQYNAEVNRGLVHTIAMDKRMKAMSLAHEVGPLHLAYSISAYAMSFEVTAPTPSRHWMSPKPFVVYMDPGVSEELILCKPRSGRHASFEVLVRGWGTTAVSHHVDCFVLYAGQAE